MELIFGFIFEVFGEALFQGLFEYLAELGTRHIPNRIRRPVGTAASMVGFAAAGALAGAVSLVFLPHSLIENETLRAVNLVVTPLLVGGAMMGLGRLRARKGEPLVRLDRFGFALLFAFSMAAVRYFLAT